MQDKYIQKCAEILSISPAQASSVWKLHEGGATIPFMARYRKEATGNLDEVVIENIVDKISAFAELEKRKIAILKLIETEGNCSSELKKRIDGCFNAAVLEDIYLPYKKTRKTRASLAIEKGLEPLARLIFERRTTDLDEAAHGLISESVPSIADALAGARDVVAEWVSVHEEARSRIRRQFATSASIVSKIIGTKKDEEGAQKYRDYFAYSELLNNCPSHRVLAMRRGEKEGFLLLDITIVKEAAIRELERLFNPEGQAVPHLTQAIEDGYNRLLKPSIENEARLQSKNKADDEAILVFSSNLRQLLLAPPLGPARVLALDPGFRTGCKLVCLDTSGALVHHTTIYPHPPQQALAASTEQLLKLVAAYDIEAIAIGNGTAGRETEAFVRGIAFNKKVEVFLVSENGASIYSASEVGREEFPDHDLTVRGAISIGRRLLDPLSELVKIDPKAIGVGQYQHDINTVKLKGALERVVEYAVNFVGVDLNRASRQLLQHVSGVSSSLAENIVQYRSTAGAYSSRDELKKVPLMGPKAFEQCAGFLRIPGAENVLDSSAVHPESYSLVRQMAKEAGATVRELVEQSILRQRIDKGLYIKAGVGNYTIEDILAELEKPGRDPRSRAEVFHFSEHIKTIADLKTGMQVPGIVTNITAFGAFVDIGVKGDGLVHLSQLADRYVQDPNEVVQLGQQVMVTVTGVDVSRKRIELSMKGGAIPTNTEPPKKERLTIKKIVAKIEEPSASFQARISHLQKKFNPK